MLLSHHLLSSALIAFSFCAGEHRAGSAVIWLHDISIPLMELLRLAQYMGWSGAAAFSSAAFALTFVISRLILFPLWIIFAIPKYFPDSVYYAFTTCGHVSIDGGCLAEPLFTVNFYYVWVTMLGLLYAFHLYWAIAVAKMTKSSLWKSGDPTQVSTSTYSHVPVHEDPLAPKIRKLRLSHKKAN